MIGGTTPLCAGDNKKNIANPEEFPETLYVFTFTAVAVYNNFSTAA